MEGELAREVVHSTGVHETEGVAHSLSAQNTVPCDWTDSTVCQGGGHDAG